MEFRRTSVGKDYTLESIEVKESAVLVVNGRQFSNKEGVPRHVKCHKEFREDKEKSSLDSEIKGSLVTVMRMALWRDRNNADCHQLKSRWI